MNIDTNTKIPLFAALAAIPVISYAILSLGMLLDRVSAAESRITTNTSQIEKNQESFRQYAKEQLGLSLEIRERVIRIESEMKKR